MYMGQRTPLPYRQSAFSYVNSAASLGSQRGCINTNSPGATSIQQSQQTNSYANHKCSVIHSVEVRQLKDTIIFLIPLLLFFSQVAHATNESSYKYGYQQGKDEFANCHFLHIP